jgi:hypothetical protein
MANYDSVNTFELPDKKYLFVDIFCRNNELICICPHSIIKKKLYTLNISVNGRKLIDSKNLECARTFFIIIYQIYNIYTDTVVTVNVEFNNFMTNMKYEDGSISGIFSDKDFTYFFKGNAEFVDNGVILKGSWNAEKGNDSMQISWELAK